MSDNHSHTDHNSQQLFSLGDHRAFQSIFEDQWFELYHYALLKIKSEEDAKELIQDLFTELWEKRHQLEIRTLNQYLKISVRNKCIDYIRLKVQENKYSEYYGHFHEFIKNSTEESVDYNDLTRHIDSALSQLPEKSQIIFKLSRLEGFSVKEISKKVNLSDKAVEYHLTKATKTLRLSLKDFVLVLILLPIS